MLSILSTGEGVRVTRTPFGAEVKEGDRARIETIYTKERKRERLPRYRVAETSFLVSKAGAFRAGNH
jgi:hypothetical protein